MRAYHHYCWALSKSFIPSLVIWSMTNSSTCGGEKQNKNCNGEQSDLCDLEQVTLKPHLQVHPCLTIGLQIRYHSLLWGDSIRKGADLEKQICLFGVHRQIGEINSSFFVNSMQGQPDSSSSYFYFTGWFCVVHVMSECFFSFFRAIYRPVEK